MKRKICALVLCAAMVMSMSVCSVSFASAEEDWDFTGITVELDIDATIIDVALDVFQSNIDAFNEQTGADVELVVNGDDHESIMKTRMASNDMPDMFTTHGWSTTRYHDFCLDLTDEPWVDDLVDSARSIVTDSDGKICTCPLTEWAYGVGYNETVMEENGIDMYSVKTWDDLEEALQTLKDNGVTPIAFGGKDGLAMAGFLEMCNVFYTVEDAPYDGREELLAGTFSFVDHPEIFDWAAKFYDEGFYNDDVFTMDFDSSRNAVAEGTAAIMINASPEYIDLMKQLNEDDEFGIVPTPAVEEGGYGAYTVGEGTAIAISNTSENVEVCKAFLEFMTDPAYLEDYVNSTGAISGFSTVSQEDSYAITKYNESMQYFDNLDYTNFFDREYLPSGMYNYMLEAIELYDCKVGEAASKVDQVATNFQQKYEELYATAAEQEE